jgi:hypothetical protein
VNSQEPHKPLSERKEGYFIAFFFGSLWFPFGWFASPYVLFLLNKIIEKKEGKQPNRFLIWSIIGVASLPIQISQLGNSVNFLDKVITQTERLSGSNTVLPTPATPEFYMSDYQKIQIGMTYQDVVSILGKTGEERSSNTYSKNYSWSDGTGTGAMSASFAKGKLTNKGQIGLK